MGEIVGKIRALASILTSRADLASQAGLTFSGSRDLYAALGYKRDLQYTDFKDRYKRNSVANRIVEALPKATWRNSAEIIEDEDPDTKTPFEEAWELLASRLKIWPFLTRADILAGIGRYSVVLIGAPGELETELKSIRNQEDVKYLAAYSEGDAEIDSYVTDSDDPRFGEPLTYKLKRFGTGGFQRSRQVHWTRVLHIADGVLDEQNLGQPRLEKCWNLLDDLEKVTGAGSEAFWLRAHQGYQFDIDKDLEMEPGDEAALSDEVDEFVHGLRRAVRTRGVNLKVLGSNVSNFGGQVGAILDQIAGGTGIPKRILIGSEMGELASSQDRTNWQERVQDRRIEYAEPQIVRPFVDRMILLGALPAPSEGYEVRWPLIRNLDEVERADVATKWAELNSKSGTTIVTGPEIRDRVLQLPPLEEEEDLALARALKKSSATSTSQRSRSRGGISMVPRINSEEE